MFYYTPYYSSPSLPPVPTSIGMLIAVWLLSRKHFQSYWAKIKVIFNSKGEDLVNLSEFYFSEEARDKRVFLIAEHRGRVVGTAAVREAPGMQTIKNTLKYFQ